jgi:uncharacterized protein YbjT (DUF2867 family)
MTKIAITGGTGFIGRNLAAARAEQGHPTADTVVISRRTGQGVTSADITDVDALTKAFQGVDVVAHFAGINREIGDQTFQRVHIEGTKAVVEAARQAGVRKIVFQSCLRARPDCGSGYHESKYAAEEIIRTSGLDYTIFKAGMVYGRGDHMVDHLSHTVQTQPLVATVGFATRTVRPIPVAEMTAIALAAIDGRLERETVEVLGAEELPLREAVRRVAQAVHRPVILFSMPLWFHRILGQVTEWTMIVPLVAKAQVVMLSEGVSESLPGATPLPIDLQPTLPFSIEQITAALPPAGGFCYTDLRVSKHLRLTPVRASGASA